MPSLGPAAEDSANGAQGEARRHTERRYSPPKVTRVDKLPIFGNPEWSKVSTSDVERQNLTVRDADAPLYSAYECFSRKVENLKSAIALHFAHYNFMRVHQSLHTTPAVALGIVPHSRRIEDLVEMANWQSYPFMGSIIST
jgi:hypothetical protein